MENFEFKTFDGTSLSAYRSIASNEKHVVHFVHGAADRIERYNDFIKYLNDHDISFYGFDNRAHGKSECKTGEHVYLKKEDDKNIVRDVLAFSDYISDRTEKPMILIGHSMGSFIIRNVAFHTDKYSAYIYVGSGKQNRSLLRAQKALLNSIIRVKGWDHFSRKISDMGMESMSRAMIKQNMITKPIEWLTTDREMFQEDVRDIQLNKKFTVGSYSVLADLIESAQKKENIKRIDDSVDHIFISGMDDPVGEFGQGIRKVSKWYNKNSNAKIKLILFKGMRHEVLREKDRIKVFDKIYDIISSID